MVVGLGHTYLLRCGMAGVALAFFLLACVFGCILFTKPEETQQTSQQRRLFLRSRFRARHAVAAPAVVVVLTVPGALPLPSVCVVFSHVGMWSKYEPMYGCVEIR